MGAVQDADLDALQGLMRGDAQAVRACTDRFGPLVWSLARRTTPTSADAEDAVQEIFTELWRVAGRYDGSLSSPKAFVAMIARRRLIDRARSQRRHTAGRTTLLEEAPPASLRSDETPRYGDETRAALEELERLRPEQKNVIRLAVGEGWTHERIAEHLKMPLGTVKTNLRRGLLSIRAALTSGGRTQAQEAAS